MRISLPLYMVVPKVPETLTQVSLFKALPKVPSTINPKGAASAEQHCTAKRDTTNWFSAIPSSR
ncbi:hypothetical protein D3C76_1880150 [compost metagenome]